MTELFCALPLAYLGLFFCISVAVVVKLLGGRFERWFILYTNEAIKEEQKKIDEKIRGAK